MAAYAAIAQRLNKRKRAAELSMFSMAARGDPAEIRKLLRDWSR